MSRRAEDCEDNAKVHPSDALSEELVNSKLYRDIHPPLAHS